VNDSPAGAKSLAKGYDPDYPLVGETLGLWLLTQGLGRGGMGEVYQGEYDYLHLLTLRYRAEERGKIRRELAKLPRHEQARLASEMLGTPLEPDSRFAIKVCSARSGTAGHRRFIQEAEVAQRLGDHPYIVTVHAVNQGTGDSSGTHRVPIEGGKYQDVAYMVMDLARCDYDHSNLNLHQAVHIIRCIATALDHAHRQGVVHRDLKPENILGTTKDPLLTDFGIAKELDQSLGLTRTGQIIGTLDYMSPEQATDAKSVDRRTDIYSLGVVLYEFATRGGLPYIHLAEREAALSAIRDEREEPRWPRDHVKNFPRGLQRIILKAMAHRPQDRYQEMSELVSDLDRFIRGDWIPALGRVGPARWLRHSRAVHPRLFWGLPLAALLLLSAWMVPFLQDVFDEQRQSLVRRLDRFEQVVEAIEDRRRHQLDHQERREYLHQLQDELEARREEYRPLYQRFQALEQRRRLERRLKAVFNGPQATEARVQLELAARGEDPDWAPNWTPTSGGLLIREPISVTCTPYGSGKVLVYLIAELRQPEGFRLVITEAERPRHQTLVHYRDGALELSLRRDEQEPELIHRWELGGDKRLISYLMITPSGIVGQVPQPVEARLSALAADAAVRVQLDLPAGTVLELFEIWPNWERLEQ